MRNGGASAVQISNLPKCDPQRDERCSDAVTSAFVWQDIPFQTGIKSHCSPKADYCNDPSKCALINKKVMTPLCIGPPFQCPMSPLPRRNMNSTTRESHVIVFLTVRPPTRMTRCLPAKLRSTITRTYKVNKLFRSHSH